jgi:hypothetical protein
MISLTWSLSQASRQSGRQASYFIDIVAGNDANDGRTPATAFASFSPLGSVGSLRGKIISLARGSNWKATLTLTADDVSITAHGAGVDPVIDCRETISSFAKTSGRTNVYEAAISLPGDSKIMGNVWADALTLTQVTSLALCDSTPGSSYVANWAASSTTLYVHAPASAVPISDGKTYRYSARASAVIGTGARNHVSCLKTIGNAHQDGSIRLTGINSIWSNCRLEDGCRHAALAGVGASLSDLYFYRGRNDLESLGTANSFVCNQPTTLGESFSTLRCTFDGGDTPYFTGPYGHGSSSSQIFASMIHTSPVFINMYSCGTANALDYRHVNPVFTNCQQGAVMAATGTAYTCSGGTGTLNQMAEAGFASTINSTNNNLTVPLLGGVNVGFYRVNSATGDVALNISGDVLSISNCGVSNAQIIRHQRGAVSVQNSTFGPALAAAVDDVLVAGFSGGTATYVGSNNVFPIGARFQLNGVTYDTLALWQAAGYDAGSTSQPMPATVSEDDFTRADENLEVTNWTRVGGSAAQAAVRSNQLACIGSTQTLYRRSLASADHWIRFTVANVSGTANPFVVLRASDQNNWVGIRWTAAGWVFGKCIAGTVTVSGASAGPVPAVSDDVIFAVRGDKYWIYINGRQINRGTAMSATAIGSNTGVGVVCRGGIYNPFIDNFTSGIL